jgi:hypothetical protein
VQGRPWLLQLTGSGVRWWHKVSRSHSSSTCNNAKKQPQYAKVCKLTPPGCNQLVTRSPCVAFCAFAFLLSPCVRALATKPPHRHITCLHSGAPHTPAYCMKPECPRMLRVILPCYPGVTHMRPSSCRWLVADSTSSPPSTSSVVPVM